MKYFALIAICFFVSLSVKSQVQWAPPEAEWTYDLQAFFTEQPHTGVFRLYNPHDTLVDGEMAFTFDYEIESLGHDFSAEDSYEYIPPIIKQEGSGIYRYIRNQFHLLYDFDAEIGDTLKIVIDDLSLPNDSLAFLYVDRKDSLIIGNQIIRKLYLTPLEIGNEKFAKTFWGWQYEGIGSDIYFNPANPVICDYFCIPRLRCYTDVNKKLKLVDYDCEGIILDTDEQELFKGQVSIFPNPILTNEEIILRAEDIELSDDTLLQVFNLSGHLIEEKDLVFHDKVTNTGITISEEGVYFLKLSSRNKTIVKKLVVGK